MELGECLVSTLAVFGRAYAGDLARRKAEALSAPTIQVQWWENGFIRSICAAECRGMA